MSHNWLVQHYTVKYSSQSKKDKEEFLNKSALVWHMLKSNSSSTQPAESSVYGLYIYQSATDNLQQVTMKFICSPCITGHQGSAVTLLL